MRRAAAWLAGVVALVGSAALNAETTAPATGAVGNQEIQFLAGISYPNRTLPPLDPEFIKWDGLWYQWVQATGEAHYQHHKQLLLETAPKLNLTREQLQKLLPLVQMARARFREHLDMNLDGHEKAMRADRFFLPDDMAEDLLDKGPNKKKDAPGNFDKKAWDLMISQVHGPNWGGDENGNVDWKKVTAYRAGLQADMKALDAAFTPEQRQLMASNEVGARSLFWSFNEQAFTDAFIIFSAPGADAWVAQQLGLALPTSDKPGEEREKIVRLAVLRRDFHRHFRLTASPLHYLKGSQLNLAQLEKLESYIRAGLPAHVAEMEKDLAEARDYNQASAQIVACLEGGKAVPADLRQTAKAKSPYVSFGYWHVCDISPWKYPNESKEFGAAQDRTIQGLKGLLTDTQRIVLYDAATCFIPWFTFTDPVNVGAPKLGGYDRGNETINQLRRMNAEQAGAAVAQLQAKAESGFDAKVAQRKLYPLLAETKDAEKARVTAVIERAREMADAQFELNKQAVADEYEGKLYSPVIRGYGLPNLSGTMPERDGYWPKIDWKDAEVQHKWHEKLSFYSFPTVLQVVQIRIALTKQFTPRAAGDGHDLPAGIKP